MKPGVSLSSPVALAIAVLAAALVGPIGCERNEASTTSDPNRPGPRVVAVSNHPLESFASRIGGEHVEVVWLIPEGIDPAYWTPAGEDVADMQSADLILLNGATYEKWLPTASLPSSRTVDTSAKVADQLVETDGPVHSHGPDGEHSHAGTASTTWLDPEIAVAQATAVRDALVQVAPQHQVTFDSNYGLLVRDIQERFATVEQAVNAARDTPVVFSHPVYQYLERRFGMNGRSVHWEPGSMPDEKQLEELDEILAEHPAEWFIWEGDPLPETVALLEERGLRSIVFAPCGNRPGEGDWLDAVTRGGEGLQTVYGLD